MSQNRKAAIVTGATGGIGAALVSRLAADGWLPVIGFRPPKQAIANALVQEILAAGGDAVAVALPLEDHAALEAGVDAIVALGLEVRALVLAASPPPEVMSFLKTPAAAFRLQLEAHVVGNHRLLAAVWKKLLRPRGGGHVLAVLTEAMGPPPTPHLSSYTVAKSALLALLEAAMAELGAAGLRATALSPGFTETSMLEAFPDLVRQMARERSPAKRFLTPAEVAERLALCLAAPPTEARVVLDSLRPT